MSVQNVNIVFILKNGEEIAISAPAGLSVLEVAHKFEIDLEGACGGSMACSTCHVIVEKDFYNKLPEATEEEEDMLDLAFGLTNTSRLGCQILLNKDLEGMRIRLPNATRNILLS